MPRNPEHSENPEFTPLFELGQILITPGAIELLESRGDDLFVYLKRHVQGDWSDMHVEDQRANRLAVENGTRIFSSFNLGEDGKLWVITEWDRSATTLLLPLEY